MKDKFTQTYLEIINQSQHWQDSLGGKLVTGVGSLFKAGAKGISAGTKKSAEGIKTYFKERKTKQKIQQFIANVEKIYNPMTVNVNDLIENRAELKYITKLSRDVIPPSLLKFLDLFKLAGEQIYTLTTENTNLLKDVNKLRALIKQTILQKVQNFKQTTPITQEDLTKIYLNLITEAIQDDIENQFTKLGYANNNNKIFSKKYTSSQLINLFSGNDQDFINNYQSIYEKDELLVSASVNNNEVKIKINSGISKQVSELIFTLNSANDLNNALIEQFKQFYKKQLSGTDKSTQLNNAVANFKMQSLSNILIAGNDVIINEVKWTGWFGSLKKILREVAACNLKIQQIKLLAVIYFQVSLIK